MALILKTDICHSDPFNSRRTFLNTFLTIESSSEVHLEYAFINGTLTTFYVFPQLVVATKLYCAEAILDLRDLRTFRSLLSH